MKKIEINKLKKIKKYIDSKAGYDISTKYRGEEVVWFRTVFFKLALETTKSTLVQIGKEVKRDHSTVLHARKNLFDEVLKIDRYLDIYIEYKETFLKLKICNEQRDSIKIKKLTEAYNNSIFIINNLKNKISKNSTLTENEKKYRLLDQSQKEIYDKRVDLILKSFEWKKYNSTFEKIHVGLSSN